MESIKNIFLGGTCNGSKWRDILLEKYEEKMRVEDIQLNFFNPVVSEWTQEAYREENRQKKYCDINIFCITPKMTGVYSIAELVDISNKSPNRLMVIFLDEDGGEKFTVGQWKSLMAVKLLLIENDVNHIYENIQDCVNGILPLWLKVGPRSYIR